MTQIQDVSCCIIVNALIDSRESTWTIVGNPDITPTFEFRRVGGHSRETRTVGVFLFGLVNERIGDDVLIHNSTTALPK